MKCELRIMLTYEQRDLFYCLSNRFIFIIHYFLNASLLVNLIILYIQINDMCIQNKLCNNNIIVYLIVI